jgi:hypothetical protein
MRQSTTAALLTFRPAVHGSPSLLRADSGVCLEVTHAVQFVLMKEAGFLNE